MWIADSTLKRVRILQAGSSEKVLDPYLMKKSLREYRLQEESCQNKGQTDEDIMRTVHNAHELLLTEMRVTEGDISC